ncbi:hypothetical protein WDU94_007922 [Cyamophila willieti]
MVSLRLVCSLFERIGFFNLHSETTCTWDKNVHRIFVCVQYGVLSLNFGAHLLSTVTRSTRSSAELVQSVLEDCVQLYGLYMVNYFRSNHDQLISLAKFMETYFSKADEKIIHRCEIQCRIFLVVVLGFLNGYLGGNVLQALIPLAEPDLKIRRLVYETKYPERRHFFNVRYPFIDESQSWTFEIIYIHQLYAYLLFNCIVALLVTSIPILSLNVQGQYEMLVKYVAMIGQKHTDGYGNEIRYTNIEANASRYVRTTQSLYGWEERKSTRKQLSYEHYFLREIVRFHQKLLIFHTKVCVHDLQ